MYMHAHACVQPSAQFSNRQVKLRQEIEPLFALPGVHYYGMRSERELAIAYANAGFYAYPSDSETSLRR